MDENIVIECKTLSLAGKISFPEVVQRLGSAGIERYTCDLVGLKTFYYSQDNKHLIFDMALTLPEVSETFDGASIKTALNEIQQQKCIYIDFLKKIALAGCSHYEVYLNSRKVLYFGRAGNQYVEYFPITNKR